MNKFLLTFVSLILSVSMMATTLPVEGTINNAIPEGWTYITNNPSFPDADYYGNGGLKIRFEGIGIASPVFDAVDAVKVSFEISALNTNEKTQGDHENLFTITALDASGNKLGEVGVNEISAIGTYSANLSYTGIAQIEVRMTKYVVVDGKCQNLELKSVKVEDANSTSSQNFEEGALTVYSSNSCIYINGVTERTYVEIYTITGSRVKAQYINSDDAIACHELNKGVYIIRLAGKASKVTIK